jgi:hypothetical protein
VLEIFFHRDRNFAASCCKFLSRGKGMIFSRLREIFFAGRLSFFTGLPERQGRLPVCVPQAMLRCPCGYESWSLQAAGF